ncbi:MAG: aminotransferase class V-fold PLP-dependent enzyme [Candidatus Onthomonas sp.]
MSPIYLDHAATSFPKAPGVAEAMTGYLTQVGASVNRGVYASAQQAELVCLSLREKLCQLFNHPDPACCILTPGATWGLNLVIRGLLRPGEHCLVSAMEHNAVMRPLQALAQTGVTFDRIPCGRDGRLRLEAVPGLLRPNTRLVALAHGSNVSGTVQDARAVGEICRDRGVFFLLDGAQTAGHLPIDFTGWGLSALAVPGHKGLLGPQGIGALLLTRALADALTPIVTGGTGSASHTEFQPDYLPDKFEPGTPNLPGIYGLEAAVSWLLETGVETLQRREEQLTRRFLAGLADIPGVMLAGPAGPEGRVGVFSLDFPGKDGGEVSYQLEQQFGILTRCGLHCAPSAHKTLGTFPRGTVRFSLGHSTTEAEVDAALAAIRALAAE